MNILAGWFNFRYQLVKKKTRQTSANTLYKKLVRKSLQESTSKSHINLTRPSI